MSSYCDIIKYKARMPDIRINTDVIENALEKSALRVRRIMFIPKVYETEQSTDESVLSVPIADWDMDGEITIADIEIYELSDDYEETDRSSNVDTFRAKYGYIKTDTDLPITSGNKLKIEYYISKYRNNVLKDVLIDLNFYMANDDMFSNIPFEKLQDGISEWSLNGVSVRFDSSSFEQIKQANKQKIDELIKEYVPTYSQLTSLGFGNDDNKRVYFNNPNLRRG